MVLKITNSDLNFFDLIFIKAKMNTLDQIGLKYVDDPESCKGKNYRGGDKTSLGHGFTERYDTLFSPFRNEEINLLELGVLNGRSLAMWSDYFAKGQVYGIDINLGRYHRTRPELEEMGAFTNQNVAVVETDLTQLDTFQVVENQLPDQFEIIIDDALHQPKAQFNNFKLLFPRIARGGIYVIEDIVKPQGFIQHFGDILAGVSRLNSGFANNHKLNGLIEEIESIEIRNNMVVFIKK